MEYKRIDVRVFAAFITMAVTPSMLGASVLRRILGTEQVRLEEGTVTVERVANH